MESSNQVHSHEQISASPVSSLPQTPTAATPSVHPEAISSQQTPINTSNEKEKRSGKMSGKDKGCLFSFIGVLLLFSFMFACGMVSLFSVGSTFMGEEYVVMEDGSPTDKIVVYQMYGMISESESTSLLGPVQSIFVSRILQDLDSIQSDPDIKAVVLVIESPGGEVVASDVIFDKIMELRDHKPVVAYTGTMAASGGYYIASAADRFYVHPSAITGSIGVILQTTDLEGLYEKLGIQTVTFKSGRFKDNEELFDEDTNGELEDVFQSIVDESYEMFVQAIMEGRGMSRGEVLRLADGRLYTGKQAVENGLADGLGYIDFAINEARSISGYPDASVIRYQRTGFFESFFGITSSLRSKLTAPVAPKFLGIYYLPAL